MIINYVRWGNVVSVKTEHGTVNDHRLHTVRAITFVMMSFPKCGRCSIPARTLCTVNVTTNFSIYIINFLNFIRATNMYIERGILAVALII